MVKFEAGQRVRFVKHLRESTEYPYPQGLGIVRAHADALGGFYIEFGRTTWHYSGNSTEDLELVPENEMDDVDERTIEDLIADAEALAQGLELTPLGNRELDEDHELVNDCRALASFVKVHMRVALVCLRKRRKLLADKMKGVCHKETENH